LAFNLSANRRALPVRRENQQRRSEIHQIGIAIVRL
jgi:hypothetical protein